MGTNEVPPCEKPQIDDITHSMENLNLDIQKMQQSQRPRKPNRQYYNQDILTDFDKWWGYSIFLFENLEFYHCVIFTVVFFYIY